MYKEMFRELYVGKRGKHLAIDCKVLRDVRADAQRYRSMSMWRLLVPLTPAISPCPNCRFSLDFPWNCVDIVPRWAICMRPKQRHRISTVSH